MEESAPLAVAQLEAYFDLITGGGRGEGWVEVRSRTTTGMRAVFFAAGGSRERLVAHVLEHAASSDVYVGVALRARCSGDRASVSAAWTVWADCDSAVAVRRLAAFSPAPSLVVASGTPGHMHAYWSLAQPLDADGVERVNRRLAATLAADRACVDASRILRPPGTLNHKGGVLRPVRIVGPTAPTPIELDRLVASTCRVAPLTRQMAVSSEQPRRDDPLLGISALVYVPALLGQELGRDHKVRCPFHPDRHPSLHAYAAPERGWYCFGCRRGGSIYDFGAALWGLGLRGADFLELRRRLEDALGRSAQRARGRGAGRDL